MCCAIMNESVEQLHVVFIVNVTTCKCFLFYITEKKLYWMKQAKELDCREVFYRNLVIFENKIRLLLQSISSVNLSL